MSKKARNDQLIKDYIHGMSCKELSNKYNISRQRTYQILQLHYGKGFSEKKKQVYLDKVLACIIDYKLDYNGQTPGIAYMIDKTGLSTDQRLRYALKLLEENDKIIIHHGKGSISNIEVVGSKWIPPA